MALKKPGDIFKHPQAQPVFTNLSNIQEQLSKAEVLLPKEKVEELRQQLESVTNSIDTSLSEVVDNNVDYSVIRKELDNFNTKITHIEEDLNEKVNDLRQKHTDIKTGIQIVQTRQNNIDPEKLKEEVIYKVRNILIGDVGQNIRELEEKVELVRGSYNKTLSNQKMLSEGLLNEPPDVNNDDPLTPLKKKFVTLDEFQSHYKIFINRIQQQLATLGGGGAVNIREMDDVDHSTARVNGKYLKYNSTTNKWEGADASGGSGSLTIQDEGSALSTAATTLNFVGAGVSASGTGATKTINISGGGGGGSQNLFQTIAVSGQDNVVADSTTDTLTFVGGNNVTITTNATSDTVSFASTFTNTQLSTEEVQDIVGGMFSGNTETNIVATYQDGDGTIDLVASGALATRTTTTATTGSIAQAASTNITIPTAGKTFSLLKLAINAPAWVVLYIDSASRSSDASRTEGTDPAPGSGVLTEVSTTASGASTFNMTPAVLGWNNDGTPAAQVYAKVVNKRATSGSNTITVTLTNLALEA